MGAQRPLELILARNLLSSLSTPGLLVGEAGRLLFYNEAAGAIFGRSFEEATGLTADEWTSEFGPLDADGEPIAYEHIQATHILRAHIPFHGEFSIKTPNGRREISLTAIPIVAPDESTAAIVMFWPTDGAIHSHAAHVSDRGHEPTPGESGSHSAGTRSNGAVW
jgi:PAS domain-containing protein